MRTSIGDLNAVNIFLKPTTPHVEESHSFRKISLFVPHVEFQLPMKYRINNYI